MDRKNTTGHPQESEKQATVIMVGCFDTKGEDFDYLHHCLSSLGLQIISINTGVKAANVHFPVTIEAEKVASAAGVSLNALQKKADRNLVVEKMGQGAAGVIAELVAQGQIDGAIGMGGGGGTYIALAAMQPIPIGIPKLCLSTVAAKDLSRQVGTRDITLMPSVVDVAGLNRISSMLIGQAAGALAGMMKAAGATVQRSAGAIAVSMFGNTTPCVEYCTALLKKEGYEVLSFHAVGVGGKTMEALISEGYFDAVLDITTTELADELCDGICSAGPDRLTAAARMGIPQVVVPGCLDMVNYGHMDTVPERFRSRKLFSWAPDVTLMRTNAEENRSLGATIAEKLNRTSGKAAVLLPLQGISIVSSRGGDFYAPEVDQVLFETIKEQLRPGIPVLEIDANINDAAFAEQAVKTLLELMASNKPSVNHHKTNAK